MKDTKEFQRFLALFDEGKARCRSCEGQLVASMIECYDHDNGIYVPADYPARNFEGQPCNKNERQWVSVHCDACGYDSSWWKIMRQNGLANSKVMP